MHTYILNGYASDHDHNHQVSLSFSSMAESKSMKILSICKVVPTDSPSEFSLPLTFFDKLFLPFNPVSRVFFYKLSEPNADFFHANTTVLPKLKQSLSLSLNHYLPLAGNLTWPHDSNTPVIHYKDGDGLSLTIVETQADFDYLSGDSFRESAELHTLVPNFPTSETLIPSMTMQITLFPNQGFSVAYVGHHAVMDGKSISMFLHSWACICRKGDVLVSVLPLELTPSYDRTFVQHHEELVKLYPKGIGPIDPNSRTLPTFDLTPTPMMLGTFKLTREDIEAMKKKAMANHTRVSTLAVTHAYVTICLTIAKKVKADLTMMRIGVNSRLRLDPPLPATYFGNCLVGTFGIRDTKDLFAKDGFVAALSAVSVALENLNEGILKLVERQSKFSASPMTKSSHMVAIGGSPQFELYKVDFGWGKPVKVDMVSLIFSGAESIGNLAFSTFSLLDDRDGNGELEIGVALRDHETEAFATVFANGIKTH